MFVFFVIQLAAIMEWQWTKMKAGGIMKFRLFQLKLVAAFSVALFAAVAVLAPVGYFGPLSSRVRGLFVQHTRTGNPLVDSVAEHQATHNSAYYKFFQELCFISPFGIASLLWNRNDAKYFLLVYSLTAAYFSRKMNRLMLLLSPPVSILGGLVLSGVLEWSLLQLYTLAFSGQEKEAVPKESHPSRDAKKSKPDKHQGKSNQSNTKKITTYSMVTNIKSSWDWFYNHKSVTFIRCIVLAPSLLMLMRSRLVCLNFVSSLLTSLPLHIF